MTTHTYTRIQECLLQNNTSSADMHQSNLRHHDGFILRYFRKMGKNIQSHMTKAQAVSCIRRCKSAEKTLSSLASTSKLSASPPHMITQKYDTTVTTSYKCDCPLYTLFLKFYLQIYLAGHAGLPNSWEKVASNRIERSQKKAAAETMLLRLISHCSCVEASGGFQMSPAGLQLKICTALSPVLSLYNGTSLLHWYN